MGHYKRQILHRWTKNIPYGNLVKQATFNIVQLNFSMHWDTNLELQFYKNVLDLQNITKVNNNDGGFSEEEF